MAGLVDKPNRVVEYQKFFQTNSSTPLWILGGPSRKGFVALFFGGLAVGATGATYALTKMIKGKK
ncbi:hypothetical protein C1646_712790 [Rhizophagus diaphanus]|nr:hypothetical protein C1646_712790 [Rhizophagus diaphanus] [Rhizophagus sp. MUCL 43196]